MELDFHPDTSEEVDGAYRWYESKSRGLGEDFLVELDAAFSAIRAMPLAWPLIKPAPPGLTLCLYNLGP